jgi:alpha-L-rhamnosidase
MITPLVEFDSAPLLRREFDLETGHGAVSSAELIVTALGVVEPYVNGALATDAVLSPGWSSYQWRLRFLRLDVTASIRERNVLGLALGNGWYRGHLAWTGAEKIYGSELAGFAELTITFEDGGVQRVVTNDTWAAGPSAVLADDLYDGETIDARRRDDRWLQTGGQLEGWVATRALPFDTGRLEPYIGPVIRRQESVPAVRVWTSPSGKTLADFGQNLVGWLRVSIAGARGAELVIRHAEVLEDEELGTRPLRGARATDRFILSGGDDVFEPTFTLHGFRYVEVTGWPGVRAEDLIAVVVGSELDRIGTFECSDPLLNQLHHNVVWSTRGNFVDVPTDCPQRDERLGWTGDIAVFAPTASYLYDVDGFLRDWLRDLAVEQKHQDGIVPPVVPDVLNLLGIHTEEGQRPEAAAIWSDAAVWVPWALWQAYGDEQVLDDQFDSIMSHLRRARSLLSPSGLWDSGYQYGDWLDPDAPPERPGQAKADKGVVATASLYRSATMAFEMATVLGRPERREIEDLALRLRRAFRERYVDGARIFSDAPTVYALAIVFGLLDTHEIGPAGDRLVELVADARYRVSTGFAGTPYITDALTIAGHIDDAYRLLLERENPSWLYPVTMGATTIWERWDSMLPDGTINPGEMTSFNHYALGAVGDWMHRTIAGLAPLAPGYSQILFAPRPGGGLTWAAGALETPNGRAAISWRVQGDLLTVQVDVPIGSTAVLRLPGLDDIELGGGAHAYETIARTPAASEEAV